MPDRNPAAMDDSPLDAARLRRALPAWNIHCLQRTGSTNDEARRLALEGAPGFTVVLAEEQTAGRGRRGSRWISPAGRNAILSVLLRPGADLPPEHWARLTLAAAMAGCDALDALPGLSARAEIKWPNDIYLSGRKVAGILVESLAGAGGGSVTVGLGCNLNLTPEDFPPELRDTATSVWIERGGLPVERTEFVILCLQALEERSRRIIDRFPAMRDEAWSRSWLAGRAVSLICAGRPLEGIAAGLGPEGELLLHDPLTGTTREISSADLVRPTAV